MTTTEKLQRIRAKCVELLALAKKRTPGTWSEEEGTPNLYAEWNGRNHLLAQVKSTTLSWHEEPSCAAREAFANAQFIAACAGSAEAGWRSTIAAIDSALDGESLRQSAYPELPPHSEINSILAAWEGLV